MPVRVLPAHPFGEGASMSSIVRSAVAELAAATRSVSVNGQRVTNVASPSGANDAVNLATLQAAIVEQPWKPTVLVATTANITLSGTQTIDGIAVIVGDRVLVKDQSTASENGIYVVASGAWTRATDADSATDLLPGSVVTVARGTVNADTIYELATDATITVGSTALQWVRLDAGNMVIVRDEGGAVAQVRIFDFVGAGVSASLVGDVARITIAGGGGGGGSSSSYFPGGW